MVYTHRGHATIDGFWDRYPHEYQDVYDRFAVDAINAVDDIQEYHGLTGKRVLDIGGGTGRSAFRIAEYADFVVSIEPFVAMRGYAIDRQKQRGVRNVEFIDGIGEDLSQFGDNEFDCAVSVFGLPILWEDLERRRGDCESMVNGCLRVVRSGGFIVLVSATPGWQFDHLVGGMTSFGDPDMKGPIEELLLPHGFTYRDIRVVRDYGTVEEALATYGFIYGEKAIDYILDNSVSKLSSSLRVFHREV